MKTDVKRYCRKKVESARLQENLENQKRLRKVGSNKKTLKKEKILMGGTS